VSASSTSEPYAGIKFQTENWRWAGVPFYIRDNVWHEILRRSAFISNRTAKSIVCGARRRVLIRMS